MADKNSSESKDDSNIETTSAQSCGVVRQRTESKNCDEETQAKRPCTEEIGGSAAASQPVTIPTAPKTPERMPLIAGVPPSPPNPISMEEIRRAIEGVKNMSLSHEIALNPNFSLEENESLTNGNSLLARIHAVMHKAFWDVLEEQLNEDPPCYTQAMTLLKEVKETLLSLVPPHAASLRTDIEQKLDVTLIEQQVDRGTLDFEMYANYVITIMCKMCCPARDDDVNALKELKGVVVTFRRILEVLKKMRLDYANFTIRQMRPLIIAKSVEYEKQKFADFLKTVTDGLAATRAWLLPHKKNVLAKLSEQNSTLPNNAIKYKILAQAFVQALDWPSIETIPETLVLDAERFRKIGDRSKELVVLATIVLVTLPLVGPHVRDLAAFKLHLKERIHLLLHNEESYSDEYIVQQLPNVTLQVLRDVKLVFEEKGLPPLSAEAEELLTAQIKSIADPNFRIRSLTHARLTEFLTDVATANRNESLMLPQGFSLLKSEVIDLASKISQLVTYNLSVFGEYYTDILALPSEVETTGTAATSDSVRLID